MRVAKARIPSRPSIVCVVLKNSSSSFMMDDNHYTKDWARAWDYSSRMVPAQPSLRERTWKGL